MQLPKLGKIASNAKKIRETKNNPLPIEAVPSSAFLISDSQFAAYNNLH